MRNQKQQARSNLSRRRFLRTTATAGGAVAAYLSFPREHFALNSETLKIGLVGCGGRGTGAAVQALAADQNTVLTAMADAFEDRLKSSLDVLKGQSGERVQVDPDHCFVGFDACEKLIHSGVDIVLLAAPPGFRPAHLKACVEAGKHIFCEKLIDPPVSVPTLAIDIPVRTAIADPPLEPPGERESSKGLRAGPQPNPRSSCQTRTRAGWSCRRRPHRRRGDAGSPARRSRQGVRRAVAMRQVDGDAGDRSDPSARSGCVQGAAIAAGGDLLSAARAAASAWSAVTVMKAFSRGFCAAMAASASSASRSALIAPRASSGASSAMVGVARHRHRHRCRSCRT